MVDLVAEVRRFVQTHGLTGPGAVAVSGGADSVALLLALVECHGDVTVAHFHHGLRGADADADADFVRDLAAHLGLRFALGRADVAAAVGNLEAAGRKLRYAWLANLGADWIATGHTRDDQAETVLHRILRGTGVQGLRGIAAERPLGNSRIVRPLLENASRVDVLAFLESQNQPFRTDATNADPRFTRNRIRHELIPLLRTFNPNASAALARLAEQAEELDGFLATEAERLIARVELPRAGDVVVLDAAGLSGHGVVVRELFRRLWQREGWPVADMGHRHWQQLARIATGAEPAADFPGGVRVRRVGTVVQIRKPSKK